MGGGTPQVDPCKDPSPTIIVEALDVRDTGKPTTQSYPFVAATPIEVCIEVTSGGKPRHGGDASAAASVSVDSAALLSPHDFSPGFPGAKLRRSLAAGSHALEIEVASAPGTFVRVVITTHAVPGRPIVVMPDHHDTSPPLRSIPQQPPPSKPIVTDRPPPPVARAVNPPDPVLQHKAGPGATIGDFAVVNGIPLAGGFPPDPNASIGGTQIVETVNLAYEVFDKTSGQGLLGPSAMATIWSGFGGDCETGGHTDPVVLFDKVAKRWLITIEGLGASGSGEECFAISTSADATGSYQRYSYPFAVAPDAPKLGIWPDAYYASYNNSASWACAYDRTSMLAGAAMPAGICFAQPSGESTSVPSDVDGPTPPPAGEPNFYLGLSATLALDMFRFHVDFAAPGSSTFTGPTNIPIAGFGATVFQIPQKGTSQLLLNDGWVVLPRVAYRNFGSHESLVTCHNADTGGGSTGVRWYEIRSPATTPTLYQQGTYGPDASDRFYCSAAMDGAGNLAVGYSVSSSSMYPAIRFAGRFASDPLNTLRAESSIVEGGGSQSGTVARWGDYSGMAIDPADDRTFVYTNEFYAQTGGYGFPTGWSTRMATFTLDPFSTTGSLGTPRFLPAIALLPTGNVLVAGGSNGGTAVATAELYNPATGTFTATGSMSSPRSEAQAIVLPNGKVLVAGGYNASGAVLASAELYDPATGVFTPTGSMSKPRVSFAAAVLPTGKVLIAAGSQNGVPSGALASAELYDPRAGTFTATGSLAAARIPYSAVLLPTGKVLIAGGYGTTIGSVLATAELYDPATGTFATTGAMSKARVAYAESLLPNGKVLIAGGTSTGDNTGTLATAELYDPAAGTFSPTGSLNTARFYSSTGLLLPNGHVLIAGGRDSSAAFLASAEEYDPVTGAFLFVGTGMSALHFRSPWLLLPTGKAFIAGGSNASATSLATVELYDSGYPQTVAAFVANGAMTSPRTAYTATQLATGNVLIAGGTNGASLSLAELYNPVTGAFTATGSMAAARSEHTATLLPNGKVLIAGGLSGGVPLASAELYDAASGTFTLTGAMTTARSGHTATLLPTGKVLIAGGLGPTKDLATAELYDPATGTFTATGTMTTGRTNAAATLLSENGKVLVAGGVHNKSTYLASAELYDPWAGTFTATGSMATPRAMFTGVLLANGSVLAAGGASTGTSYVASAELYNPYTGTFAATASMATARASYTGTALPNGRALIAGGFNGSALAGAELYDPVSKTFVPTGAMLAARSSQQATLLRATGKLLMAGGQAVGTLGSAELYQ